MRLSIHHVTSYRFAEPVRFGLQQVRKTPKTTPCQTVLNWRTEVTGGRKELVFEDHHHNTTELISFDSATERLDVLSEGEVEVRDTHGIIGAHRGPAPLWLYGRVTPRTEAGPLVRALLRDLPEGVLWTGCTGCAR
ncbi:MAG: transglutaminase N-terminal domain-containing protein [Roseovarius sp.]|nr:transglutaminase N-terminal domain-containing protein [Roseovarius sp.]